MTPQDIPDVTLVPPVHLQLQLEDVNVVCERYRPPSGCLQGLYWRSK